MNSDSSSLPTLEQSLAEITALVDKMEQGELTLEQSLQDFERGVTLVKHCQKLLKEAELRVEILSGQSSASELTPYKNNENDN